MTAGIFDKPDTEKRGKATLAAYKLMLEAHGRCPGLDLPEYKITRICGVPLSTTEFDLDHKEPLWRGGTNGADNWVPLCKPCHAVKTAAEAATRAKADRAGGRKGQWARRAKNGSQMKSRPMRQAPDGYSPWKRVAANVKEVD